MIPTPNQWRRIREAWSILADRFIRFTLRIGDKSQCYSSPLRDFDFDARNHELHSQFKLRFRIAADEMWGRFR